MKSTITSLLILLSTTLFAQNVLITADKKAKIDEYVRHFEKENQMMGNLSIFENGTEVIDRTFGSKNNSETKYYVGSITKLITGILFAQMEESKMIDFDEKLSNYFPQIENSKLISIKQLLNHTSGLKDFVVKQDTIDTWLFNPVKHDDIIAEIKRQGAAFKPGDSLKYSNSGYYLLARILEKKYNKKFDKLVSEKIVKPLKLKNTLGISINNSKLNTAKSYEKKDEEWIELKDFYFPNVAGVGDLQSTPHDLNIIMQALFSGKLIKQSTLDKMLPSGDDWFGEGIMKMPFLSHIGYGHGGDTFGTHSGTSFTPKNKLAISYAINGENYSTNDFAIGLLSIIYDQKYKLPEFKETVTYTVDVNDLANYAGTYGGSSFPLKVKIYVEKGQLTAQADGQTSLPLIPSAKDIFEFADAGIVIEFNVKENSLTLKQSGQIFQLKKI